MNVAKWRIVILIFITFLVQGLHAWETHALACICTGSMPLWLRRQQMCAKIVDVNDWTFDCKCHPVWAWANLFIKYCACHCHLLLPPCVGRLGKKVNTLYIYIYILFIGIYRFYVYINMFHIISLSISKYIIHQHKVEFHRPADVYHSLCQPHMPQPQRDVFPKFVSRISTYISHSQFWICRGCESSVCCELFFLGGQKHRFPVAIFSLAQRTRDVSFQGPAC